MSTPIHNSSFTIHNSPIPYFPLFPRARFTLLIGDPGTGKSLLATHLAARQSLRSPLPPDPFTPNPVTEGPNTDLRAIDNHPGLSILCSKEDDDQTQNFRLDIAAEGKPADSRFIRFLPSPSLVFKKPTPDDFPTKYSDLERTLSPLIAALTYLIETDHQTIGLLILDPLPAFLENLDASNNPALIRRALTPLIDFAYRHNITLVGISHLSKSSRGKNLLFQAANSFAYTALARSVLLLTHDTITQNPMRRLLIPIKNSFALPTSAYSFTLHSTNIQDAEIPFPYLTFDPAPISNHPLLPTSTTHVSEPIPDSNLELAEHFLKTTLIEGPLPSAQLLAEARSLGISTGTFQRARQNLQATSFRTRKRWFTHLPNLAPPEYEI